MLIRYADHQGRARLGLVEGELLYDLTATGDPRFETLGDLLGSDEPASALVARVREAASKAPSRPVSGLFEAGRDGEDESSVKLLAPIDRQEVWAAGVTYKRSEEARKAESEGAALFYAKVYEADRPELFFKATASRCAGPFEPVGIRSDSRWNVPEPELGVVLTRGLQPFGYVVGNDMSSRDIEGENPLYLPQAKVYSRACGLGPGIALADAVPDPAALRIAMRIFRREEVAFSGETSTREMKRSIGELVAYLGRANTFPHGAILLTGTGIVPDDAFTLQEGDRVEIEIDAVGRLVNPVITVS